MNVKLLQIVEVPKSARVRCRHVGCAHPVYKRIHVLSVDGEITFVGSECFKKHYAMTSNVDSRHLPGGSAGASLTEEEAALLESNTTALLASLKKRYGSREKELEQEEEIPSDEDRLWDYAVAKTKEKFRSERGINPELPGWSGWAKAEAKTLFKELKKRQRDGNI